MRLLTALALVLLIVGCGSTTTPAATVTATPTTSTAQSMTEWKHGAADAVHATGEALTALGGSMKAYDLPAMHVNCTHLRSTVDKLERTLPSPNRDVTAALQDSIDDFRSLTQLCMTINPSSTDEVKAMSDLVDHGSQRMTDAFNLMNNGW